VRWRNGVITRLGTLGGRNSEALDVNIAGVIVGWSETASGTSHAFVWQNGVMRDLGTLGGPYSRAFGINSGGKIVGSATVASGESHAVSWKDGVMKDLGTNGHQSAGAKAINTRGQIVVDIGPWPDAQGEELDYGFVGLYYRETWSSISSGGPAATSEAINRDGLVVGGSRETGDDPGGDDAWVWRAGGGLVRLPSLTPSDLNYDWAYDINSFGNIVGSSTTVNGNFPGPQRAVIWHHP
jgi:probable HAF family extracellular repeat protein